VPATGLAAYAIYTSGTTGTPKGVVIGRAAFATAVRSSIEALGLDARTRSLCVSPFHFDGAFATLFTTLAVGGSLILPGQESIPYARYFFRTVAREGITYTGFSPTYLRLILTSPLLAGLAETPLRAIALGGEACSAHDVAALHAAAPEVRVFNRYGPTETTIVCTHFDVTGSGEDYRDRAVPIGVPHPGVTFHLVDENGQLIDEIDRPGELYIGGAQLMDGYWGAAELTAQVMRTDIVPGRTVYRSGDLVRRDASGNYVYVDRLDHVVIRNANRISMVELAQAFRGLPGVTAATCAAFDDEGRLGLATFVVTTGDLTSTDVHLAAISQVPERMMPNVIKVVDAFPHTSSNKVDTRALLLQADLRPI
jgi:acyl-CoA synthetase (AMP-forming)/AMP-acid ligase II